MPIDQAKLKALKAQGAQKVGGQRVKNVTKTPTASSKASNEVTTAITRLGARPIPKVTESWFFHADQSVQIFKNPKLVAAPQANLWCISGASQTKQMGPETMMEALGHMGMEQIQGLQQMLGGMGAGMPGMPPMGGMPPGFGGEDIPNFDEVEGEEAPDLVE